MNMSPRRKPGAFALAGLPCFGENVTGIENESVGYAMIGAPLASGLWLIPIIGAYLIGVAVSRIAKWIRAE